MEETSQGTHASDMTTGYRIFSTVRTIFVYLLAAAIIIGAAMFASNRSPDKSLFGYRYYIVLTDSMAPVYHSGDMVFVHIEKSDNIKEGDVITFNPSSDSGAYLTHRVTEKITNYEGTGVTCFRTKGDANDAADSFLIDESRVIGVVQLGIPKLGFVVRFVQLRWFFIVPLIILMFVFFGLMKRYFMLRNENETENNQQ